MSNTPTLEADVTTVSEFLVASDNVDVINAFNRIVVTLAPTKAKKDEYKLTAEDLTNNIKILWRPSLKISKKQSHEDYLYCCDWWFRSATADYWAELRRDYPDTDPLGVSKLLYIWLKANTEKADFRTDLNLTLRNTWLRKRQRKAEANVRFNMYQSQSENKETDEQYELFR